MLCRMAQVGSDAVPISEEAAPVTRTHQEPVELPVPSGSLVQQNSSFVTVDGSQKVNGTSVQHLLVTPQLGNPQIILSSTEPLQALRAENAPVVLHDERVSAALTPTSQAAVKLEQGVAAVYSLPLGSQLPQQQQLQQLLRHYPFPIPAQQVATPGVAATFSAVQGQAKPVSDAMVVNTVPVSNMPQVAPAQWPQYAVAMAPPPPQTAPSVTPAPAALPQPVVYAYAAPHPADAPPSPKPAYRTAQYPPAEATHEQIYQDRDLFMHTLRRLHDVMGTKFRIPSVSGQELDFHLLYKQVTNHGGLEAVMSGKKWTDVCAPFNFPSSFTSRSFTMRKVYSQYLHHFEQVYYFRNTGPVMEPPGSHGAGMGPSVLGSRYPPLLPIKRPRPDIVESTPPGSYTPPQTPPAFVGYGQGPGSSRGQGDLMGSVVSGTVDAKFDCGYFITLNIKGYEFKGMLYNPPPYLPGGQQQVNLATSESGQLRSADVSPGPASPAPSSPVLGLSSGHLAPYGAPAIVASTASIGYPKSVVEAQDEKQKELVNYLSLLPPYLRQTSGASAETEASQGAPAQDQLTRGGGRYGGKPQGTTSAEQQHAVAPLLVPTSDPGSSVPPPPQQLVSAPPTTAESTALDVYAQHQAYVAAQEAAAAAEAAATAAVLQYPGLSTLNLPLSCPQDSSANTLSMSMLFPQGGLQLADALQSWQQQQSLLQGARVEMQKDQQQNGQSMMTSHEEGRDTEY